MIARARLVVLLLRPPVAALLALFASIGASRAGAVSVAGGLAATAVMIAGFLLFSVAVNDLSDARIDRVNLAGDRRRPLVVAGTPRADVVACGAVGAVVAVLTSAATSALALAVTLAGLAVSAAYSLRPVRLADRGAAATLVLPSCYVAVPYVLAFASAHARLGGGDLELLAGLYCAFLGRIVLKDFRDVRGDALFGKRTFLVRHGRHATCAVAALGWSAGTALIALATPAPSAAFAAALGAGCTAALGLLRRLAATHNARVEEWTIAAVAIVGRGMLLALLAQLEMVRSGWTPAAQAAGPAAIAALTAAQAALMLRAGPAGRTLADMPIAVPAKPAHPFTAVRDRR